MDYRFSHCRSLHPSQLTSLLLSHILSSSLTSDLSLAPLIKVFDHLSRTHRNALRGCVVGEVRALVGEEGEGGGRGGEGRRNRFAKLSVLVRIATRCQALLSVVSEEVLKIGRLYLDCMMCVN